MGFKLQGHFQTPDKERKKRMRKSAGKGTEESWEKSEDGLKRLVTRLNLIIQHPILRKFRAVTG